MIPRTRYRSWFLLFPLLLAGGCDRPQETSYFPLSEDISWEYRIEYKVRGETRSQRLVFSGREPVDLDQQRYYPRISLSGHKDYYQKTDAGVVHVDPVSGDRTTVLPKPVEQGQQWQGQSKIRVLQLSGAFEPTFKARIKQPITLDYEIVETGETVSVAAGEFKNCIRVRSKGRLFAGLTLQEHTGIDSIYIEQTDWYAPGTGLIKTVRTEYTEPNDFRNTYTQELLAVARR